MSYSSIHVLYPKIAFAMVSGTSTNVADKSITVSTASIGVSTPFAYPNVPLVTFDVQTSNLRCRWDGTAPTSTTGHLLVAGSSYTWDAAMFNAALFIRDTAATVDGTIWASGCQF